MLSFHRPRTLPPSITTWSKASCHPLSRLCLPILLAMCAGKSFSTLGTTCWKQAASFHQELPFMLSMGKSSQIMAGTNNQLFIVILLLKNKIKATLIRRSVHLPYARHYNPLLIKNRSWILTIHKTKGHSTQINFK